MKYRLAQIKTDIDTDRAELRHIVAEKIRIREDDIRDFEIRRMSIDSRKKPYIQLVYTADFVVNDSVKIKKNPNLSIIGEDTEIPEVEPHATETTTSKSFEAGAGLPGHRPVVIGAGPCGLFAALELARAGLNPIVIERGPAMEDRAVAVEKFRRSRVLDPEANMLFGEGGAGTFSDGKLTTGIKDGLVRKVLTEFRDAGAGEDIMYLARPHIGTDVLREVIVNMRKKIIDLGGEFMFNTRLEAIEAEDKRLKAVLVNNGSRNSLYADSKGDSNEADDEGFERIETDALILAIGHSARDTFAMINEAGLDMEQKPFSIGVRIEHPQRLIDEAQYGAENADRFTDAITAVNETGKLPPADYKLSYKTSNGRGVYSFCMCPGGEVVACSTKDGELCVNGMSNRRRDSGYANSGILCDVRTEDFGADDVLAGVRFQEKYERLAFKNGGRDFTPPSCRMEEFLGKPQYTGQHQAAVQANSDAYTRLSESVGRQVKSGNDFNNDGAKSGEGVSNSLPEFAADAIREAIPEFARKIKGYDHPNARVIAVETRSSSPVRILRDASGESNIKGIYPAGEGAGYAGGITSAACDGIRAAAHIMARKR